METLILMPTLKSTFFGIPDRQTDRRTDGRTERQTETLIKGGLCNLSVPQGTPAARGLEELFSPVLERFLQPIHALRV